MLFKRVETHDDIVRTLLQHVSEGSARQGGAHIVFLCVCLRDTRRSRSVEACTSRLSKVGSLVGAPLSRPSGQGQAACGAAVPHEDALFRVL